MGPGEGDFQPGAVAERSLDTAADRFERLGTRGVALGAEDGATGSARLHHAKRDFERRDAEVADARSSRDDHKTRGSFDDSRWHATDIDCTPASRMQVAFCAMCARGGIER